MMILAACRPASTHPPASDDFIDELAGDGIELVLANPSQQVGACVERKG
jgi:hypothetical protein